MTSTCIADDEQCVWNYDNNNRQCCSGTCLYLSGKEFGYCQAKIDNIIPPSTYSPIPITTTTPFTPPARPHGTPVALQIILSLLALILFFVIFGIFLWYRNNMRKSRSSTRDGLTRDEIRRFLDGNPEVIEINKPVHEIVDDIPYDRRFEIPETSFTIDEKDILGAGAFGLVCKGNLYMQQVAIKMVKPNSEKVYLKALLTELKILIYIGQHENIVRLLGAHTSKLKSGKLYLFLEYCEFGNLLDYLRKIRGSFNKPEIRQYENLLCPESAVTGVHLHELVQLAIQIANALRFLSDKKVIHGDVAARNVLLVSSSQAKLTDFGLSRRLYEYTNYVKKQQEPMPWRWMSVEALREFSFSTPSDVWSFGVTLWEIFSLGHVPFPGLSWTQDFPYKLADGFRLSKPDCADNLLYDLMCKCWALEPKDRPSFLVIHRTLVEIYLTALSAMPK